MEFTSRHIVTIELIIGNSKEHTLSVAEISLINMEERLGTILVSIIKKIKLKAIKLKLVGVKCNKKNLT